MVDREDCIYFAKLAEQAERYEEMVEHVKTVAKMDINLSTEERNLLSVAYKNVVGSRRHSWRILSSYECKENESGNSASTNAKLCQSERKKVEGELKDICNDIINLLDEHLIKVDGSGEKSYDSLVFYIKMKGDYYRYMAEFLEGSDRQEMAESSLKAYQQATEYAVEHLQPQHPIRLGLALNFSVFYYEILNSPDKACGMARSAFDDALTNLDQTSDESYKDSTLILQLLRDNLTLWSSDSDAGENKQQQAKIEDLEDGN